jgi:hypothetical protein
MVNTSRESHASQMPDAATVAAEKGALRYYLDGQSTSLPRYVL